MAKNGDSGERSKRRRAAFRHAVFTKGPIRLTAGYLSRVRPGRNFAVNERFVSIPGLPDELCGMKITHLSDPHIGELVTPAHLPHIVEAANKLRGDLVVVTGDFIDFSNEYLPDVVAAMKQLRAPLGSYFVLGNHDYLDNAEVVKKAFHDAGLNLLMNQGLTLPHRGRTIGLGGIDWSDKPERIARSVQSTAKRMKPSDLTVLLAHHPHAFDTACRCGIDLTLSGHTHGGQVLIPRGNGNSIGLAHLAFRYTRGLYSRGPHRLFVSSGVGSWFPIRFRCPAEITSLELQGVF